MSDDYARRVIGGEFELNDLPLNAKQNLEVLTQGIAGTWTSSGRAALAVILEQVKAKGIRHLLLPAYLCESILLPVRALGFDYSFYPVDAAFAAAPDPRGNVAVLTIDYFGWPNDAAASIDSANATSVFLIRDACQSFLTPWRFRGGESSFLLTGPRKFGPTIFGGWCSVATPAKTPESTAELELMWWKSLSARLLRGLYLAKHESPLIPATEAFYLNAFTEVETFLDNHPTATAVPQILFQLIRGLDWPQIAARRRANWQLLHEQISAHVDVVFPELPGDVVPLGYVVRLKDRDRVREALAAERIFCPIHWRLPSEIDANRFSAAVKLSQACLTLPIDQRYGEQDISRLASALLKVQ